MKVLETVVLAVRDRLRSANLLGATEPYAIGLRLSAVAARELLAGDQLANFKKWLEQTNTYVFTINGFPYGSFHGAPVKEQVFKPDWTDRARLEYTQDLFRILAVIARPGTGGASVSTLPGSHKTFAADDELIRRHLIELAEWLEDLATETGHDFHLGLEPEPLGHFENTVETLKFFEELHEEAPDSAIIQRRIGLNYDACHFALEYDPARWALDVLTEAGIRISKIHLSSALSLDPGDPAALAAIRTFEEPIYFHQVLLRAGDGTITRFLDLTEFFAAVENQTLNPAHFLEMRVHFHIPLDAELTGPLHSTRDQTREVLSWQKENPTACDHYEIETYTWGVLPDGLRRPVEQQIAGEYAWVLGQ